VEGECDAEAPFPGDIEADAAGVGEICISEDEGLGALTIECGAGVDPGGGLSFWRGC